jgi:hypothetical protein
MIENSLTFIGSFSTSFEVRILQLPQIRIHSQAARIEINSKPSQQSIEQPKSNLDIQQPRAELTIDRIPSKLTIDQTGAWESMDLKHIFRRIEEYAQKGKQDWLEGVGRRASEGDDLMRIENKSEPIKAHAKRNSEKPTYPVNIRYTPPHFSVKIDYDPGKLNINWEPKKVINNTQAQKPIIDYQPGNVATSLKNTAQLNIDFVNLKFKGINYEQEI